MKKFLMIFGLLTASTVFSEEPPLVGVPPSSVLPPAPITLTVDDLNALEALLQDFPIRDMQLIQQINSFLRQKEVAAQQATISKQPEPAKQKKP